MSVKNIVNETLTTPMSRKEFLGQVGALFLAIIGVSSILHALGGHKTIAAVTSHDAAMDRQNSLSGYGSSAYGG